MFKGTRKMRWSEEFSADEYATKKSGKGGVLNYLIRAKTYYETGIGEYNYHTHPPIEDRIKKISNLQI